MKQLKKQFFFVLIVAAQSIILTSAPNTPEGHRRFESDNLRFHKPSVGGVTHWKLVPNESQFDLTHTIVAQIVNGDNVEETRTITSLTDATQLLETAIKENKTIEWYYTDEQ